MRRVSYIIILIVIFALSGCRKEASIEGVVLFGNTNIVHHITDDFMEHELEVRYTDGTKEYVNLSNDIIIDFNENMFLDRGIKDVYVEYDDFLVPLNVTVYEYDLDLELIPIYALALNANLDMTYDEWLESIKGEDGSDGAQGVAGLPGVKGDTGADGVGIRSVSINSLFHLIIEYTDDSVVDAGSIVPVMEMDYTVTYHTYVGLDIPSSSYQPGDMIVEPVIEDFEGVFHYGWFLDEALTIPYTFDVMPEDDLELYLKYSKYSYLVNDTYSPFVRITGYEGNIDDIITPEQIENYDVMVIGSHAFSNKTFHTVVIPDTVYKIDTGAFMSNEYLESVVMTDSVVVLGSEVFKDCTMLSDVTLSNIISGIWQEAFMGTTSLIDITFPDMLVSIGDSAFENSSLSGDIVFPTSLDTISSNAFKNTQIENVSFLGDTLVTLEEGAFSNNESLETISLPLNTPDDLYGVFEELDNLESFTVPVGNVNAKSIDGVLYNGDATKLVYYPRSKQGSTYTIPDTVTSIERNALRFSKHIHTLELPDTLVVSTGLSLTEYFLEDMEYLTAFNVYSNGGTEISSIDGVLYNGDSTKMLKYPIAKPETVFTLPPSVEIVHMYAAEGNRFIEQLVLNEGLHTIYHEAFKDSHSLHSVTFSSTIQFIENEAFMNNNIATLDFSSSTEDINLRYKSFSNSSSLTTITFGTEGVWLGDYAFENAELIMTIKMPSVGDISSKTFVGCTSLESVNFHLDNTLRESIDGVVYMKGMTHLIYYPEGKTDTTYTIPEGVIIVWIGAIKNNVYLEEIHMATTIEFMYDESVYNLPNLEVLYFLNTSIVTISNSSISFIPTAIIYVDSDKMHIFQSALYEPTRYQVYPVE